MRARPAPAMTFDVVGAAPTIASWAGVLHALAAWPSPETILIERRVVRTRAGLRERIVVGTDLDDVLGGNACSLDGLVRPLRTSASLRRRGPDALPDGWLTIATLPDLGSGAPMFVRGLAEEVVRDLALMPVGSGIGMAAWTVPPLDPDVRGVHEVLDVLWQRAEVVTQSPGLGGALRIWCPRAIDASLLARVAALTGLRRETWVYAEDERARHDQTRAIETAGVPPIVRDDEPEAVRVPSAHYLANLLGYSPLSPPVGARAPRIGRPYPDRLPREGVLLGKVLTPAGSMRDLRLPWSARARHTFVCGATGSGKSELVARLAVDDVREGRGLLLIDPHGDVADRVLGSVPPDRHDEVVLIEPHDERTAAIPALVPGLDPRAQVAMLDDLYSEIHDYGRGFHSGRWRRQGRLVLDLLAALPGVDPTFAGLDRTMLCDEVRAGVIASVPESALRRRADRMGRLEWDRVNTNGSAFVESAARHAFDHAPRWSLDAAVAGQQIVVAKLDVGRLGAHDTGRIGRMLLRLLFNALTASHSGRPATSIVVDEAHLFCGGPVLGTLLAQSRKFGASLTLCTQAPSRLREGLLTDVLTNCGTMLALELPAREARVLAERDPVAADALPGLPVWHAAASLDGDRGGEAPLIVHPIAPIEEHPAVASAVIARARSGYGRTADAAARGDVSRFADLYDRMVELTPDEPLSLIGRRRGASTLPLALRQRLVEATLSGEPLPEVEALAAVESLEGGGAGPREQDAEASQTLRPTLTG